MHIGRLVEEGAARECRLLEALEQGKAREGAARQCIAEQSNTA